MNLPTTPDLIDREQFAWDLLKQGWNSPNDAQHTKAREFADALNDCHREKLANATAERDEARANLAAMREAVKEVTAILAQIPDAYDSRFFRAGQWADAALAKLQPFTAQGA